MNKTLNSMTLKRLKYELYFSLTNINFKIKNL